MEGKKRRALGQNCHAVSEVYGQLLMISIVVLAFSTIALTVFSDGGAVKPEHIPNTDLRENVDMDTSSISITHGGGEAIDLSAIKIILSVKKAGDPELKHLEFSGSSLEVRNPDGNPSDDDVFILGNYIVIDTTKPDDPDDKLTLESNDDIDMFFVDIPSQQVIQKAVLQKGSRESEFPYWVTPHPYGSVYVYDNFTSEWLPTELVDGIGDGITTDCQMYQDQWSSQNFTFGIEDYELDLKNPLKKVELKIVYTVHDNSQEILKLEINDKNPDEWVNIVPSNIDLKNYKTIAETDQQLPTFDITDKVSTVEELRNLTVSFSAYGRANSNNKFGWVDFIGIHVEC
ncbi:MAG: type IV pilin N-terminal domain-containing protein [Methanosarcina sp.]|jgi:FlaG/FlaF family flagellin (archaellin)|nr:type IV pilin N-terminal domain-containing protein [Methanosarcina sp.]MDD3315932.1 type IV pilin N-terminal domain-containing protein [Methanosarcina sp.]MDD4307064.1 type IV pilin N-terminal domain-containing protein [Methanosarcina sp.]MDD4619882.1 type IV pilin N-terminal domain-containing protein [Methanosarcina sp.]